MMEGVQAFAADLALIYGQLSRGFLHATSHSHADSLRRSIIETPPVAAR